MLLHSRKLIFYVCLVTGSFAVTLHKVNDRLSLSDHEWTSALEALSLPHACFLCKVV